MTPEERKNLAEQITRNPLFTAILDEMETNATQALIFENNDIRSAQMRVRAIQQFRADLAEALDTHPRKPAPA